jgi:hypothetical protein
MTAVCANNKKKLPKREKRKKAVPWKLALDLTDVLLLDLALLHHLFKFSSLLDR